MTEIQFYLTAPLGQAVNARKAQGAQGLLRNFISHWVLYSFKNWRRDPHRYKRCENYASLPVPMGRLKKRNCFAILSPIRFFNNLEIKVEHGFVPLGLRGFEGNLKGFLRPWWLARAGSPDGEADYRLRRGFFSHLVLQSHFQINTSSNLQIKSRSNPRPLHKQIFIDRRSVVFEIKLSTPFIINTTVFSGK